MYPWDYLDQDHKGNAPVSRLDSKEADESEELPGPVDGDFTQLLADLEIPENKLLQAHPQIQKKLRALLYRYQDIFSNSTWNLKLNLELKTGTQPIRHRFRDFNQAMEEKLQEQIRTWQEEGLIETFKSSPIAHEERWECEMGSRLQVAEPPPVDGFITAAPN